MVIPQQGHIIMQRPQSLQTYPTWNSSHSISPQTEENRIFKSVLHFLTPAQSFVPPFRHSVFLLPSTAVHCPLRHSPNTIFFFFLKERSITLKLLSLRKRNWRVHFGLMIQATFYNLNLLINITLKKIKSPSLHNHRD